MPAPSLPSASELGLVTLLHRVVVTSTMDVAHEQAASGAPAGTLILADAQTDGRGRSGRKWVSAPGDGVWCTLVERPDTASGLHVLSLRLGLALACALQPFVEQTVRVKWPNDLYVAERKLAGILVEARWRQGVLEWVAVGIGINLCVNDQTAPVAALRRGTTRNEVLRAVTPSLRLACAATGPLTAAERAHWELRDVAVGQAIVEPVVGIVRGLDDDGALRVACASGVMTSVRAGSLVFAASSSPASLEGAC